MKNSFLLFLLLSAWSQTALAVEKTGDLFQTANDSIRIAELDRYWEQLNKSVMEGDFEANKQCFHEEAVIVFASGQNKVSVPVSTALASWEESFKNTKDGRTQVKIEVRFSQRIGSETTAHETGIFTYESTDISTQQTTKFFIPFEMLLVKRNDRWLSLMEYQKPLVTKIEWDALKRK